MQVFKREKRHDFLVFSIGVNHWAFDRWCRLPEDEEEEENEASKQSEHVLQFYPILLNIVNNQQPSS